MIFYDFFSFFFSSSRLLTAHFLTTLPAPACYTGRSASGVHRFPPLSTSSGPPLGPPDPGIYHHIDTSLFLPPSHNVSSLIDHPPSTTQSHASRIFSCPAFVYATTLLFPHAVTRFHSLSDEAELSQYPSARGPCISLTLTLTHTSDSRRPCTLRPAADLFVGVL